MKSTKCAICGKKVQIEETCTFCGTLNLSDGNTDTDDFINTYTDNNGHIISEYFENEVKYVNKKFTGGGNILMRLVSPHNVDLLKKSIKFNKQFTDNKRKCEMYEYTIKDNIQIYSLGEITKSDSGDNKVRLDIAYIDGTSMIAYSHFNFESLTVDVQKTYEPVYNYNLGQINVFEYTIKVDNQIIPFIRLQENTYITYQNFLDLRHHTKKIYNNTTFITEVYDNDTLTYEVITDTRDIIKNDTLTNQLINSTKNQTIKL